MKSSKTDRARFLPMTRDEMSARGWRELDVLLVTGDAYFDHPTHGAALLGRLLESEGYRVGIIAQPNWRDPDSFRVLGRPTLFVGVTAGAVDSFVNNSTAFGAKRKGDVYSPGGIGGRRPDYATLVYANRLREVFPELPVVLGGVEASLRRFAWFDPRKGRVRRSVLVDSRADILVYGAGEEPIVEIAHRLAAGRDLAGIFGTARLVRGRPSPGDAGRWVLELPSYEDAEASPDAFLTQTLSFELTGRPFFSGRTVQRYPEGTVLAEPRAAFAGGMFDRIAELPFTRQRHPLYDESIPALETVLWSVTATRGCPGGCSFCGLAAHQGRAVVSRSAASVLEEVARLTRDERFRGTISDVGGPTANAYDARNTDEDACRRCKRPSCLHPKVCRHLNIRSAPFSALLESVSALPRVKNVFVASGIRHDVAVHEPEFVAQLASHHTGGHLKLAPEHVSARVLELMRKPPIEVFERFESLFATASRKAGKKQYVVPYFIAGFPGCTHADVDFVRRWLRSRGQCLRQVQAFMPLAGTAAAAFAHSGKGPKGGELFVPSTKEARAEKSVLLGQENSRRKQGTRA